MDIKKIQVVNIVVNVFITVVLIFSLSAVSRFRPQDTLKIDSNKSDFPNNQTQETKKEVPTLPKPEELATAANSFDIQINSDGYATKGIAANMAIGQTISLKITNDDSKPHSFVIEDLKVNSGAIAAGAEKTLSIDDIPNITKVYEFYSDQKGDDRDILQGTLFIIKK